MPKIPERKPSMIHQSSEARELSRSSDPLESHLSAEILVADGTQSRMMSLALEILRKYPGKTANELEEITKLRDGKLRKRLNDLLKRGLARKGKSRVSSVSGRLNATWYANES